MTKLVCTIDFCFVVGLTVEIQNYVIIAKINRVGKIQHCSNHKLCSNFALKECCSIKTSGDLFNFGHSRGDLFKKSNDNDKQDRDNDNHEFYNERSGEIR